MKLMHLLSIKSLLAAVVLGALSLSSCTKQTPYNGNPLVISTFNGLDNGALVYGNYSDTRPYTFLFSQQINNGAVRKTAFESTEVHARYFIHPDTLEKDNPVFDRELPVENGKAYSLYLVGDKPSADYLFLENKFKRYEAGDSLTYVQVVNISNDAPVSVNIQGNPAGSLISKLPYKSASEFLPLPADLAHAVYVFEFRDAATGDVLFTNPVTIIDNATGMGAFLYKNWTLSLMGKRGVPGVNALKVATTFHQ